MWYIIESRREKWGVRGVIPHQVHRKVTQGQRPGISQVCPTASMTPSYFHRKQKESRLNQQNFLAVQILTYDLHICDRSNLFLGFFLGQSERKFKSIHFTSSVAKSSAVCLQIHVPSPLPTQYNVERSKELCLDGFNTVCGVGGGGQLSQDFCP